MSADSQPRKIFDAVISLVRVRTTHHRKHFRLDAISDMLDSKLLHDFGKQLDIWDQQHRARNKSSECERRGKNVDPQPKTVALSFDVPGPNMLRAVSSIWIMYTACILNLLLVRSSGAEGSISKKERKHHQDKDRSFVLFAGPPIDHPQSRCLTTVLPSPEQFS